MGADFNVRPVGAPVATPIVRPAPEAVREAVPTQLPPDKRPRRFVFVDALPRNANGKVVKRELRKQIEDENQPPTA